MEYYMTFETTSANLPPDVITAYDIEDMGDIFEQKKTIESSSK